MPILVTGAELRARNLLKAAGYAFAHTRGPENRGIYFMPKDGRGLDTDETLAALRLLKRSPYYYYMGDVYAEDVRHNSTFYRRIEYATTTGQC